MPHTLILLAFVSYVCLVNFVNVFLTLTTSFSDPEVWTANIYQPLHFSVFYIFNFLIFFGVLCYGLDERNSFDKMWGRLVVVVLICLTIQVLFSQLGLGKKGPQGLRTIMFFNNPNQLAYFSLCTATLLFLAQALGRQSAIPVFAGYMLALYISLLALSKGALIGIVAFPIIYLLAGESSSPRRIVAVCVAAGVLVLVAGVIDQGVFVNLDRRLADFGVQSDDSLAARGYVRILSFPEYMAFGAGEGMRFRFGERSEIHSLYATVLFSYGLVGVALVAAFVVRLVVDAGLKNVLFLVPVALYNLTHNGIRNPLLWMMFALIIIAASRRPAESAGSATAGPKRSLIGSRQPGM